MCSVSLCNKLLPKDGLGEKTERGRELEKHGLDKFPLTHARTAQVDVCPLSAETGQGQALRDLGLWSPIHIWETLWIPKVNM